jgi:sensor histidine kinase regulating citrate/malate metabolism
MWPNAVVDFFDQHWIDLFDQYWSYAALAALIAILVLLWKTWRKVRSVERQLSGLRVDMVQIQNMESRLLLAAMRSAPLAIIESPDSQSIVPEATASGQPSPVNILQALLRRLTE